MTLALNARADSLVPLSEDFILILAPMDGASGAFAVVSLAIQLFEIVQKTNKFIKDLRNVPGELTRLCENLDQLGSLLENVRQLLEQQFLVSRLPGTPIFILSALQQCARALEPLKKIVDEAKDASSGHRSTKTGKSLRHVMKKEHIQELMSQLRDAKFDLQSAVLNNSWQLQYVINDATDCTNRRQHTTFRSHESIHCSQRYCCGEAATDYYAH